MAKSSAELKREIAKLQKELDLTRKKEIASHVAEIRGIMKKHGITASDLGFIESSTSGKAKPAVKRKHDLRPKYRHPVHSDITWSGYGRAPRWAADAKKNGKLDTLLIVAQAAPVAAKKAVSSSKRPAPGKAGGKKTKPVSQKKAASTAGD